MRQMLKEKKSTFNNLFRFSEICILVVAFASAYYIRFEVPPYRLDIVPFEFQLFFLNYLVAWMVVSNWLALYASKRFVPIHREVWDVIRVIGICFMVSSVPVFFFRNLPLSRMFIILSLALQTVLLIIFRCGLRKVLKFIRLRGYNYRQVLIVGRNRRSEEITQRIFATPEYGIRILGFIDALSNRESSRFSNYRILGTLGRLEVILQEHIVDEVLVTLPIKSFYSEIEKIITYCEKTGVEVKLPADFFSQRVAKSSICNYYGYECIDFFTSPQMSFQLVAKRIIDVVFSGLALVLLAPLFLVVAVSIKATSEGPVFFLQPRLGYNGRVFNCIKFRTMVKNACQLKSTLIHRNEMDGPVFKIRDDPRVTKIGRFLRRNSIDELPQLINVIRGEMSLVGPRPPISEEVQCYRIEDRRRLSMRPGMTCLWQVSGRNNLPFDKWMELDRSYIDQWSLWLDFKIIAKTITAVVKGEGAA
jgi:exopolysaccharide biosynthesis polyprenyl glycosylphosphotransferase